MHIAGEWFVNVNAVSTATCMHTYTHMHTCATLVYTDMLGRAQQL